MAVVIAVVGDVHGSWDAALDEKALRFLKPDVVLFTGDFGDEDVKLVKQVSKLAVRKAAILGNHDSSWGWLHFQRKKKSPNTSLFGKLASFFFPNPNSVEEQLAALGDSHIGYNRMDLCDLKLSVVGARPFAMGGDGIYSGPLIEELYGIADMKASARKIVEIAASAPEDHALIFLGHSGPTGLGSQPHDICGKDFSNNGGDNGDPDVEEALKECRSTRRIPLVVFGHMHHKLMFNLGHRKMCVADDSCTVYVNGAVVPRQSEGGKHRQFTVVELSSSEGDCKVTKVSEKWVSLEGPAHVAQETVLYSDEN